MPAAGYEIDFVKVRGIDRRNPLKAARAGRRGAGARSARRARSLRRRGADVVIGGGGFVAGPAGLAAALTRTPLVLTEADSHLGLANRLLAGRARRVCLAFPIEGREGERYLVTGRPVPRAVLEGDRRGRASGSGSPPTPGACSSSAAARAHARSTSPRSRPSPRARRGRPRYAGRSGFTNFHVVHIAGSRDFAEVEARLAAAPTRRPLHAARVRAEPRRRPRRLRPGPRPLGRLDLRGRRRRPAGDPRPLSLRHRRPPERQRRVDAARAARRR